jgi:hypothetical protein
MRKLSWVGAGALLAWFLVAVVALMQPDPQISAFRNAVDADRLQQTTAPGPDGAERGK